VIANDCNRIYEVIVTTQLAIGGPFVLILSAFYIIYELGPLALVGLMVFPLFYPIQVRTLDDVLPKQNSLIYP